MTREFLQVRSDHGYLIHAVDSRAERSGFFKNYIGGRPICGKIIGRANGFPTLRLLIHSVNGEPDKFTSTTLQTTDRSVCVKCAERVMQASD